MYYFKADFVNILSIEILIVLMLYKVYGMYALLFLSSWVHTVLLNLKIRSKS